VFVRDLSTENLVYLSSEQALADLAHFSAFINQTMNLTTNKWIAFGGSYPGKDNVNEVLCKLPAVREIYLVVIYG
jgi:hypothetical protein